ncbi:unnamed protein product [Allacma fusca]|uniref:Uncharacterized protein n=1 Tax=Allacma fusca TaxID=39272 RepID=A0A8J2KV92_9HEXA|nr:unnamed protein product [Allacma fusca]
MVWNCKIYRNENIICYQLGLYGGFYDTPSWRPRTQQMLHLTGVAQPPLAFRTSAHHQSLYSTMIAGGIYLSWDIPNFCIAYIT